MKRLVYLDRLKGFLIMLVVLGHIIQCSCQNYDNNIIFRYIYSFHMPLFFFISGFLNYRDNPILSILKRRFFSLIIPFFSWLIVSSIIKGNINLGHLVDVIMKPDNGGLWFLWVLFFCIVIMHIVSFIGIKSKIKQEYLALVMCLLLTLLSLVTKTKIFGFNFISWYFLFYSIGFYYKKHELNFDRLLNKIFLFVLVFFPLSAYFWMRKDPPTFYVYLNLGTLFPFFYKFIVALFGIIFFIGFFKKFASLHERTDYLYFNRLGEMTLGIYATHLFILGWTIKIIENCIVSINLNLNNFLFVVIAFVLLLISSVIIVRFLSLNRYSSKAFLGK